MTTAYPEFIAHIRGYVDLSEEDVEKGCLRMFYINDKMTEVTMQFALETWWLSDYFSFARQMPSEYSIQAVEKSVVVAIDYRVQDKLFAEVPQLKRYFRIMIQRALAAAQLRVKLIYQLSKEEMYRHFNASFPEFFQRVPQYMIASYLGITPEYLSELRKKK